MQSSTYITEHLVPQAVDSEDCELLLFTLNMVAIQGSQNASSVKDIKVVPLKVIFEND